MLAADRLPDRPKLVGCTTPRVFTPPLVELTRDTSLGFGVIDFSERVLHYTLFPWQEWALIHALELLPDGSFRFRTIVILVARQNGKTKVAQVLTLYFLFVLSVRLVIGTAQDLDTAEEVWDDTLEWIESIPTLARKSVSPIKMNGKKTIRLTNGCRYKVKAASRRGGRGLSGDVILLDELREHQNWNAWGAITKTTMARENALVWVMSNAGDALSVVLKYLRLMAHQELGDPDGICKDADPSRLLVATTDAIDDEDDDDVPDADDMAVDQSTLFLAEWSAPPNCKRWDRQAWAQANPSLGFGIAERAVASAARTDPDPVFRTEVLCQWIEGAIMSPFPAGTWVAGVDDESTIGDGSRIAYALDVSWNRSAAHVAAAGHTADGVPHVEVIASRAGTDWVIPWFTDPNEPQRKRYTVAIQSGSPAGSLIADLEAAGIAVQTCSVTELGRGCGLIFDSVVQNHLVHRPQQLLDVAADVAVTREVGDSWVWDRKASPVDIAPLVAVTGALWLLGTLEEVQELDPFFAFA